MLLSQCKIMKEVNHHYRSCVIKAETVTEVMLLKLPVIL